MLKLEMKLNNTQILQEAKYQPDSILNAVDKVDYYTERQRVVSTLSGQVVVV